MAVILEAVATHELRTTGKVDDLERLLQPENLAALSRVAKLLAFLAFHPGADNDVREYVLSGALAAVSGPDILVLFCLDENAETAVMIDGTSFVPWLTLEWRSTPAYALLRLIFGEAPVPAVPGLVFFAGVGHDGGVVYVPLVDDHGADAVRAKLRRVFAIAAGVASRSSTGGDLTSLAAAIVSNNIEYVRSDPTSFREWLLRGWRYLVAHGWDLVSLVRM